MGAGATDPPGGEQADTEEENASGDDYERSHPASLEFGSLSDNPWLIPCAIFAAVALFAVAIVGALIWAIVWMDRSDSPRAGRLRRLLGGREKRRPGGKRFFWLGEDRLLRHAAAQEFASKRGWRYEAADSGLLPALQPFNTVPLQSAARIEDVIRWENLALFTYTYQSSESSETNSLLCVGASTLHLPPFLITAETAAHKMLFADRDIDFEDDAEFSSRFHVESSDQAAMREILTSEVRAEFVAVGNCRIECVDSKLVFIEQQQTTVGGFEDFVDESVRLLNAMGGRWGGVRQFRR